MFFEEIESLKKLDTILKEYNYRVWSGNQARLQRDKYRFVSFQNYEHDDIIPFTFEISFYDNRISVVLRNINDHSIDNCNCSRQYFNNEILAFSYINELRKFICLYKDLENIAITNDSDLLPVQVLITFKELCYVT
jgi:hypothetical protein